MKQKCIAISCVSFCQFIFGSIHWTVIYLFSLALLHTRFYELWRTTQSVLNVEIKSNWLSLKGIMFALNTTWYFILLVLLNSLFLPSNFAPTIFFSSMFLASIRCCRNHFSIDFGLFLASIAVDFGFDSHNAKKKDWLAIVKTVKLLGSTLFFSAWKLHAISDANEKYRVN